MFYKTKYEPLFWIGTFIKSLKLVLGTATVYEEPFIIGIRSNRIERGKK